MTPEDKAREITAAIAYNGAPAIQTIAAALRQAIEDCAAKAEWFAEANKDVPGAYSEGRVHAGQAIAAHIRTLATPSRI